MRIESQPALEPAPAPRRGWRRWRRWRLGRWFIVAMLAFGGYGAWREYDFRAAIKEAQALGWHWTYDDPFDAIQKDWKAAFRKATWTDGQRYLDIPTAAEFEAHARLVPRLAPKSFLMWERPELKDLSALKGLPALQKLSLLGCTGLTNVDELKGQAALQEIALLGCTGLTNVDRLKGLPVLQVLELRGCTGLRNVDGLKGLPTLQRLDLNGCTGLTNVDALKGLPALQVLDLFECTKLSAEAIAALRASLPNAEIVP